MRHILCDISHPAHVHFFRNAVSEWRARGHRVDIVSRDKDITLELLDLYGLEHEPLSAVRSGLAGLAIELIEHEGRLIRRCWSDRPDIFIQIGGTLIVHAAKVLNRPSIVFYDTEFAKLSNAITYPFASAICTPGCYDRPVRGNHVTYAGYHELAYLHPDRFTPDPNVVRAAGADPGRPFSVVRFVRWDSNHDTGYAGLDIDAKRALVAELGSHGDVLITSETPLPEDLEPYRSKTPSHQIHHLLAFAAHYVGESATMASESAVLGTPGIFVSDVGRGYTDEQERKYGLCQRLSPNEPQAVIEGSRAILAAKDRKTRYAEARQRLLGDTIDVTAWMVDFVETFQ